LSESFGKLVRGGFGVVFTEALKAAELRGEVRRIHG
jgi:hypothetical protein